MSEVQYETVGTRTVGELLETVRERVREAVEAHGARVGRGIEIEIRLGLASARRGGSGFIAGVDGELHANLRRHLDQRHADLGLAPAKEETTMDIIFPSGARVVCRKRPGGAFEPCGADRKTKLRACTLSSRGRDAMVRIGVAEESDIQGPDRDCALRDAGAALEDAASFPARCRAAGAHATPRDRVVFDGVLPSSGSDPGADPLLRFVQRDPRTPRVSYLYLDPGLSRAIPWTVAAPTEVPTLDGRRIRLHTSADADSWVHLVSLPCSLRLPDGGRLHAPACRYAARIPRNYVELRVVPPPRRPALPARATARLKRRWAYEGGGRRLDLTCVHEAPSLLDVPLRPPVFEVELEVADAGRGPDATAAAVVDDLRFLLEHAE